MEGDNLLYDQVLAEAAAVQCLTRNAEILDWPSYPQDYQIVDKFGDIIK